MKIENHRLVDAPFRQASTLRHVMAALPSLLVVHYTATHDAKGVIAAFQMQAAKASAHLVIDVDGSITQMVEFNRKAAHAGMSSWMGRASCNDFSIGIELVNPGPLVQGAQAGVFVDTIAKRPWMGDSVEALHKNGNRTFKRWAVYPDAQLEALTNVARAICDEYRIRAIVGHDDIAPDRKSDPGPAFPMKNLRNAVLGSNA